MPANYRHKAIADARYAAKELQDQIIASVIENKGPAPKTELLDYDRGYEYEPGDTNYSMTEAGALLDELHEFEETDAGLWEGQPIRTAVVIAAGLTYRNATFSLFRNIIEEINEKVREELGGDLFSFERWYLAKSGQRRHGVLDWAPGVVPYHELPEAQQLKIDAQHEAEIVRAVTALVRQTIRKW